MARNNYIAEGRCKVRKVSDSPRDIRYVYTCAGAQGGQLSVTRIASTVLCNERDAVTCSRRFRRGTNGRDDTRARLVEHVYVNEGARRHGVATALYEAAAKDACRAAEPLVSAYRVYDAHSNTFWKKQHAKRRAVVVGVRHDAGRKIPVYALDCARGVDLSGIPKKRKARCK